MRQTDSRKRFKERVFRAAKGTLFAQAYLRLVNGEFDDNGILARNAVWHVPGLSRLAGSYVGEAEIRRQFQTMAALSGGTLQVELESSAESEGLTVLTQLVTATRGGVHLEDHQRVRLRLTGGHIKEAWVEPSDLQAHDAFWGWSRRPLFTPEDQAALSTAFREGSRKAPSGPSGLVALLIAMLAAAVAIFAYDSLHHWRRPVAGVVSTQRVTALEHVTMAGGRARVPAVSWILDAGYISRLTVSGPEVGTAEVVLPITPQACPRLAAVLQGDCGAGQLALGTPVAFEWSNPQAIASTDGRRLEANGLDLTSAADGQDRVRLTLFSRTSSRPSLCFSSPQRPVRLSVGRGQMVSNTQFTGDEPAVTCHAGLRVVMGSPGSGQPPTFEFDAVDSITLHAWTPAETVQGLAGQISLTPGGTTVLGSPSVVSLRADRRTPLATTLEIAPGRQSFVVRSPGTRSVLTDQGDLVPSEWERDPGIIVPLLGGFLSALVLTPLGVAVQGLMGSMRRWQDLLGAKVGRGH